MKRLILLLLITYWLGVLPSAAQVDQHLIDSLKNMAMKFKNSNIKNGVKSNPDSMMAALNGMLHLVDSTKKTTIKEAMKKAPDAGAAQKYLKDYNGGDTSYVPVYFSGRMFTKNGQAGVSNQEYNATVRCTSQKAPLTLIGSTYTVTLLSTEPTDAMANNVTANKVGGSIAKFVQQRADFTAHSAFSSSSYEKRQVNGINLISTSNEHSAEDAAPPVVQFIFSYDTLSNIGTVSCMRITKAHRNAVKEELDPNSASSGNQVITTTENVDFSSTVAVTATTDDRTWNLAAMNQNKANADLDKLTAGKISGSQVKDDGTPKPILKITREPYGFDLSCLYTNTQGGQSTVITITAFIGKSEPDVEAVIYPVVPVNDAKNYTYEHWLPKGPKVDGSSTQDEGDTKLAFKIKIVNRKDASKKYHNYSVDWRLEEVTQYAGYCNNFPKYTKSPDINADLRFAKETKSSQYFSSVTDNDAPTLPGQGEFAEVRINCMDYAAWGKLTATVTLDDGTVINTADPYYDETKDYLTIPFDNDDNKLADWWEDSLQIKQAGHPLTWDNDSKPDKQRDNGDGYTLFEEYRGFAVHNAVANTDTFTRTDPAWKDVFVYDKDGLFKQYYEGANPSHLRWHYITQDQIVFLENDKLNKMHRWVNFNKTEYFYANQYSAVLLKSYAYNPCRVAPAPNDRGTDAAGITWDEKDYRSCQHMEPGNPPVDIFDSPFKHFIETVIYFGRIKDAISGVPANVYQAIFNTQVGNTLRHEIGHYLGIQHHLSTDNTKADTSDWRNTMDGVEDCLMRYANPDEASSADFLLRPFVSYCGPSQPGFENIPVVATDANHNPLKQSDGIHYRHRNVAIPKTFDDNCFGQITVKSTPDP